ncbi:MAG: flavodoxin domain-containing protein [Desulfobacterales bacterium]|jgi:flavorubredoxin|nr:flavodoxin domain-containing protein [Desulfobacterales bacterium]
MKPIQIAEKIFDVGVTDWNIRDFHGYSTEQGSTYNAFLILDEKIALIDTVKKEYADQLLSHISQIVDPARIDYVISNHTEMDHTGALAQVMQAVGTDTPLVCSKMGHKNLSAHFRNAWNYQTVQSKDTLSLGSRTLSFLETRMLHWPDSMFTYLAEDKILFSSDAFGQHYAGPEKYDDVMGEAVMPHARKYFANILLPYSDLILKLIEQVGQMGLEIKMICPDHGVIWRKQPEKIIEAYGRWSRQIPEKKALVVYDTMWHSTEKMAEAIVAGFIEAGVWARPIHIRSSHRSEIMAELMDARAIVIGSPTLNNGLFPTVSDFLTYMKGLRPKNKIGAAFGSYGWSGEAVKLVNRELEDAKIQLVDSGLKIAYVPGPEQLEQCVDFGKKIAAAVLAD